MLYQWYRREFFQIGAEYLESLSVWDQADEMLNIVVTYRKCYTNIEHI